MALPIDLKNIPQTAKLDVKVLANLIADVLAYAGVLAIFAAILLTLIFAAASIQVPEPFKEQLQEKATEVRA